MQASFFSWLSRADFYVSVHTDAVALAPGGGRWIDVGCGPGLVATSAALRGFSVQGFDRSAEMIAAARARARSLGLEARASFEVATLEELAASGATAEVVSAASLLYVLPEPAEALGRLWRLVAPGGSLLLVETTPDMRLRPALRRMAGRGALGLALWGLVRDGRSVAPAIDVFQPPDLDASRFHPLLGGLVGAWLLRRRG